MPRNFVSDGTERWLLNAVRLPGRLNVEQTAQIVGCQAHDIPQLVKAQLLKPLGGGPRNTVKYFAAVDVERNVQNLTWLDKATKAISRCRGWTQPAAVENGTVVARTKKEEYDHP